MIPLIIVMVMMMRKIGNGEKKIVRIQNATRVFFFFFFFYEKFHLVEYKFMIHLRISHKCIYIYFLNH